MEELYLVLENGMVFKGKPFGHRAEVTAEIVFATGMTGYLETLTDPSYFGQIILQTFPLIGNYGVIPEDFESGKIFASGYIVRDLCREPSNFRSRGQLDELLKEHKVVGLYGIDTRALTKIIRESGVMNGCITADPASVNLSALRSYRIKGAVAAVSTKEKYRAEVADPLFKVALIDAGAKHNIISELNLRRCSVVVFPHDAPAEEILAERPDGVMVSNGPGDPADNPQVIATVRRLLDAKIPMFGICLGHQLIALAGGFKTEKLKFGHRGANQPVKDTATGRVFITSQNHGYAVTSASIDGRIARLSYVNLNDGTCEGLDYVGRPAFGVQFHPEHCPGPRDTAFLFDRFLKLMEEVKNA